MMFKERRNQLVSECVCWTNSFPRELIRNANSWVTPAPLTLKRGWGQAPRALSKVTPILLLPRSRTGPRMAKELHESGDTQGSLARQQHVNRWEKPQAEPVSYLKEKKKKASALELDTAGFKSQLCHTPAV